MKKLTLIITLTLLPIFAQANGQLFRSGFIVDAADERLVSSHESHRFKTVPNCTHAKQYVFNTPADVSEREFMASVRKLDKSKEHYVGK